MATLIRWCGFLESCVERDSGAESSLSRRERCGHELSDGMEVGSADTHATFWPSLHQETKSTRQFMNHLLCSGHGVKLRMSVCELGGVSDAKRHEPWSSSSRSAQSQLLECGKSRVSSDAY